MSQSALSLLRVFVAIWEWCVWWWLYQVDASDLISSDFTTHCGTRLSFPPSVAIRSTRSPHKSGWVYKSRLLTRVVYYHGSVTLTCRIQYSARLGNVYIGPGLPRRQNHSLHPPPSLPLSLPPVLSLEWFTHLYKFKMAAKLPNTYMSCILIEQFPQRS